MHSLDPTYITKHKTIVVILAEGLCESEVLLSCGHVRAFMLECISAGVLYLSNSCLFPTAVGGSVVHNSVPHTITQSPPSPLPF